MPILHDALLFASTLILVISAAPVEERAANGIEPQLPSPLVVPPSQYWDGDNGAWSSFALRVGTPPQDVRVLVSTNSPEAMVVVPLGCTTTAVNPVPADCANSRGGLFNTSQSSTWQEQGFFGINENGVGFEADLGYSQNAEYGLDTLGLGFTGGPGGPTLENQTIAAIASVSPFYTGIFGLSTQPVNYSTIGNFSAPSYFTSLRSQKLIPSLSWSYTAGAKYRLKAGQYAQLIFGGFDTSRFTSNSASFTLAGDIDRDIVVGIQSIIYSGTTQANLLSTPTYAFIESTDPNIWLPEAACQEFEKAFGISIDESTGLYLMNTTQYAQLEATNAQVTFTLGNSLTGGETVNIILPFSAFALPASYPLTSNDTYYFPLKKAANDSQVTLGRAFLQEAYLTVDYERGNFSVSQCLWVDGAASQIESILSPTYPTNISSPALPASNAAKSSNHLSPGVIAAIVIVVVFVVAAVLGLAYYFFVYRHVPSNAPDQRDLSNPTPQTENVGLSPVPPAYPINSGLNPVNNPEDDGMMVKVPTSPAPEYEDTPPVIHDYYRPDSELSNTGEIYQLPGPQDTHIGHYLSVENGAKSNRKSGATPGIAGLRYTHELEGSRPEPQEMEDETSIGRITPDTGIGRVTPDTSLGRVTPVTPQIGPVTPQTAPITPRIVSPSSNPVFSPLSPGRQHANTGESPNVSAPSSPSLFTFLSE